MEQVANGRDRLNQLRANDRPEMELQHEYQGLPSSNKNRTKEEMEAQNSGF